MAKKVRQKQHTNYDKKVGQKMCHLREIDWFQDIYKCKSKNW